MRIESPVIHNPRSSRNGKEGSDFHLYSFWFIRGYPWVPCPIAFGLCLRLWRTMKNRRSFPIHLISFLSGFGSRGGIPQSAIRNPLTQTASSAPLPGRIPPRVPTRHPRARWKALRRIRSASGPRCTLPNGSCRILGSRTATSRSPERPPSEADAPAPRSLWRAYEKSDPRTGPPLRDNQSAANRDATDRNSTRNSPPEAPRKDAPNAPNAGCSWRTNSPARS